MMRSIARRARPSTLPAVAASVTTLLLSALLGTSALAADEDASGAGAEASPAAASPAPSATPHPAWDASTITLRMDPFVSFEQGLDQPVYITDDGVENRNCLYVVERAGRILIVKPNGVVLKQPFLDIRKRVNAANPEQGLLGLAFHPDFARNGQGSFFVHYTDKKKAAVVMEFKGTACRPGAKKVRKLLTVDQQYPNDNAGWIGFGPDGMLYVPLGDGGGEGDPDGVGQEPKTRLSKVLRLDVGRSDLIAKDNPYVRVAKNGKLKNKGGFVRETWAWGLRDPRRASFDRDTGDLWIGDVGRSQSEVDLVPSGSVDKQSGAPNFGWSDIEGTSTCQPDVPTCDPAAYVPPVYAYDQALSGQAITGGYVYRGEDMPRLKGKYLFGDFRTGQVWGLDAEAVYKGFEPTVQQLLVAPLGVVSFGEDDAGELYLVTLEGSIYRLNTEAR